jgi:hypothetical protein
MVVVLALDIVALRSRELVQWDAGVKSAKRRAHQFTSTEAARTTV